MKRAILIVMMLLPLLAASVRAEVRIGLNYPQSGPYAKMGLDQLRAARMAIDEINAVGGVLGRQLSLVCRDSRSDPLTSTANVAELIDDEGVAMVLGGSSSDVAIAAGKVCQDRGVIFFGTLTYTTETTGVEARRHVFRECSNAWMGAKVLGRYMRSRFPYKRYFYITADYSWGHSTEAAMRRFTGTTDRKRHGSVSTPFPNTDIGDYRDAVDRAVSAEAEVLVLVLFGDDMIKAIRQVTGRGLKRDMHIVVPSLTLAMADGGGPKVMEGVIGSLPWCWQVPYRFGYGRGQRFVEDFDARFGRYPSTSGASAYTIVKQWAEAVERAGDLDAAAVIPELEGHEYQLLKGRQRWRDFDHQSVQTVYVVRCKPDAEVRRDKYGLDYFDIIGNMAGEEAVRTREEWNAVRAAAGKPSRLESLENE